MNNRKVLSMVLAGGEGKRLMPLTRDRAKPAVPFGGHYRLIDFALSNLANSGFRQIVVLTQYKSHSLNVHISRTWRMSTLLGSYVTSVPAQMRAGQRWFLGSADAIFQNLNLVDDERPDYLFVFGADHIYRMEPSQMLAAHLDSKAGVTVAAIRMPLDQAHQFGVIEVGKSSKIERFREKPSDPKPAPDDHSSALVSMGNYVFSRDVLEELVRTDAEDDGSRHDIGGDLIPKLVANGVGHVYDFTENDVPGSTDRDRAYWRDVGTLDAYFEAHMDLVATEPVFNLYNMEWPIHTSIPQFPPAKIVAVEHHGAGYVADSVLSAGVIISGGYVRKSVLSPGVRVGPGATVDNCILLDGVDVKEGSVLRNVIVDKKVAIPPNSRIGVDPQRDKERFVVSPGGVVALAKGEIIVEPV